MNNSKSNPRWLEYGLLLLVLGIAAYLRMGWPDVIEFKRDEANLSLVALDFANGKTFPLLGITSSVGFPNAPFNAYVLAIPYFFTSNPIVATQFIGLLNVLAIWLVYFFLRRYTAWHIALMMCLLLAVAPWGIIFSRKIWAQNMLPFFVLLTLLTGVWAYVDGKKWAQVVHWPSLVVLGQIHYGAFVMIPAYGVLWLAGRRNFSRYTLAGILLAVLLCLPYLIGLHQGGFLSVNTLRNVSTRAEVAEATAQAPFTLSSLREAGVIIAGTEIHSLAGPQMFQNYLAQVPAVYPLFNLLAIAVLVSFAWLLIKIFRQRYPRRLLDVMVCLWLAFPIVIFTINWTSFYIHYLIPILPGAFIALGFGLNDLQEALKSTKNMQSIVFPAGGVGLVIICALQVALFANLLNFLYHNHTPNGFGTPIGYLMDLREHILRLQPQPVIAQTAGQSIGFDDDATILKALLYDVKNIRFEDSNTQVYSTQDTLLIATDNRYEMCFYLRPDEGCYSISQRPAISDEITTILGTFDNGVQIIDYSWNDETNCLVIRWRITQLTDRQYAFAIHGYNASDERHVIADGISWFSDYWQIGDIVDRTFCLQTPIAYILLGMYHLRPDNTYEGIQLQDTIENSIRINLEYNISHSQ